jgi:hypothetical protein
MAQILGSYGLHTCRTHIFALIRSDTLVTHRIFDVITFEDISMPAAQHCVDTNTCWHTRSAKTRQTLTSRRKFKSQHPSEPVLYGRPPDLQYQIWLHSKESNRGSALTNMNDCLQDTTIVYVISLLEESLEVNIHIQLA